MITYKIRFYYLATGMEGTPLKFDLGKVVAEDKEDALEKVISSQIQKGLLSAKVKEIEWFKSCLTIKEANVNTEHVSVPRKEFEEWMMEEMCYPQSDLYFDSVRNCYRSYGVHLAWKAWEQAILSRAAPSVPTINIKCETRSNEVIGTATLNVLRVEAEDDGSFTAVTDHWPTAPRVVTEEMALTVRKEWESWARSGHTLNRAWIEALKSFATSLPVEIPPGYVLVPVEPTEDMYDEVESLTRCEELDLRAIYKAMLAAAPQVEKK